KSDISIFEKAIAKRTGSSVGVTESEKVVDYLYYKSKQNANRSYVWITEMNTPLSWNLMSSGIKSVMLVLENKEIVEVFEVTEPYKRADNQKVLADSLTITFYSSLSHSQSSKSITRYKSDYDTKELTFSKKEIISYNSKGNVS